jgi:hypothetical protein
VVLATITSSTKSERPGARISSERSLAFTGSSCGEQQDLEPHSVRIVTWTLGNVFARRGFYGVIVDSMVTEAFLG